MSSDFDITKHYRYGPNPQLSGSSVYTQRMDAHSEFLDIDS